MEKEKQLAQTRKLLSLAPLGYVIGGIVAVLGFAASLEQPSIFAQFGVGALGLVGLMFVIAVHVTARRARKSLEALKGEARAVTVTVVGFEDSESNGLCYQAQLEWQGQPFKLTLVSQEQVLNPILGQSLPMRAYPDAKTGLPMVLETDSAYLWSAA